MSVWSVKLRKRSRRLKRAFFGYVEAYEEEHYVIIISDSVK